MSGRALNTDIGKSKTALSSSSSKSCFDLLLSVVPNVNSVTVNKCLVSVKFILLVYLGS